MVSILPQPLSLSVGDGVFRLDGDVAVVPESTSTAEVAELAAALLTAAAGTPVPVAAAPSAAASPIELRLDTAEGAVGSSPEAYTLTVTSDGVLATATTPAGLLHAVQTLCQLVVPASTPGATDVHVPAVVVHDAPRFAWRGLSVDIARNFFGVPELMAVIDVLSAYKLNVLHLHLTDDQGWRIESPSRPELAKLSSDSEVGGGPGGYLSLADFRALQDYAAQRFVRVVPEIDVPGHINAATHVYGELMPDGKPTDVYAGIEVGFSKLTYDLPATEPFLRDVFSDLAHATDGEYVHIGGDEVLTMEADEFARFMDLCQQIVHDAGKKVVAWQEIAHAEVRPGTVVQFWDVHKKDVRPFLEAAEKGATLLLSPGNRAYLDMKYTAEHPLGLEWAGLVELRDSYDWEPEEVIPGLRAEAIEGVEAAVWTETLTTLDDLFSMLLPRLAAVAEVAWTAADRKDWDDFRARVAAEAVRWRRDGVSYHPTPQVAW
ncbi:family 20 glycosylhydrolase [Oerskovia flava]|uniref:family 20 glycosylhydrolase n=1 Tax=Oerskovia flava TaxID=2986422 RepID=UPI00223FF767|nr:family 20 glycosylhydrolase [Oerskovia sp. JB1-3-2]